ncbi:serine hydrolase domain-containing protein [Aestuariivirga sp.]|uniref:serine hydrolase domain-containing protein n=1 Tax=Aestuariivirga sp. TaxID=2650926 RepID=UPI0039E3E0D9
MVDGFCDPQFSRVRDAFASNLASGLEHGGGVSVVAGGRTVVDLWGGHADAARQRAWQRDTLVNVWSVTKGIMAIAMAMMVERGRLDYAAPVSRWWPEFAQGGKSGLTLDLVLSHQAGLNGLSVPMAEAGLYAWTPYADALAAMAPLWEPGTHCIYHTLSFGALTGEILRRVDGRRPGQFVREEIARPLGIEFHIGLPESEEPRVAEMSEGEGASRWIKAVQESPFPHSCRNPVPRALAPNDRAWRAAEIPGGNGHATARDLAAIYGTLAGGSGKGLLSPEMIREASRPRVRGWDGSFAAPAAFAAGFQIEESLGLGRSAAFGHNGWGGSIGFADPEAGFGFGCVTNLMLAADDAQDPRQKALVDSVYASL